MTTLIDRAATVRRYQLALQQDPLDASDLIALVIKLVALKHLWSAAEDWRSLTTALMEV